MKIITILFILLCLANKLSAQLGQDPEAKKILDRVSAKTKSHSTIQANFELDIDNRQIKKKTKSTGLIKIKGDKYYMESMGTKVYFDGKTMWNYLVDDKEVTITTPDTSEEDFVENPAKIFTFYNHDFKYVLVGESKFDIGWTYEIDLFPKDLSQPYSRFKLFTRKDNDDIYMISAIGKNGINYTVYLKNIKYDETIPDSQFTFDPSKHKKVEVEDMRFNK